MLLVSSKWKAFYFSVHCLATSINNMLIVSHHILCKVIKELIHQEILNYEESWGKKQLYIKEFVPSHLLG